MIDRTQAMIARAHTEDRVMPPTALYNEGWLLRSALDWFADRPVATHPALSVPHSARWYSEALLASPFLARWRGDPLAETYTHADGAVGQFRIGDAGGGDLALDHDASHFVILEAKLGSKLSAGIKNAPGYDQAARSVACMAHSLAAAGRRASHVDVLGFFVVAPASQIKDGVFDEHTSKESVREKVSLRVSAYNDAGLDAWLANWFLPMLERMTLAALSWESVVAAIAQKEPQAGQAIAQFYQRYLAFNRLQGSQP